MNKCFGGSKEPTRQLAGTLTKSNEKEFLKYNNNSISCVT